MTDLGLTTDEGSIMVISASGFVGSEFRQRRGR